MADRPHDHRTWREALVTARRTKQLPYTSRLHSGAAAARLGLALGVAFVVCFVTGLLSHLLQHPPSWWWFPTRPVWIYRVTQAVHVTTGLASIPLLLVKLWTVSPRFWRWPPIDSLLHGLERLSVLVLVGAAFFQLVSGLLNVAEFYPWAFFFPPVHYAVAWVAIGSILVHVAVKLPAIRAALHRFRRPDPPDRQPAIGPQGPVRGSDRPALPNPKGSLSRRGLLLATGTSAALVAVATVGGALPPLRRVSVLAQRDGTGPQGLPVNRTAGQAGVTHLATDGGWRLTIDGPTGSATVTLHELAAFRQSTVTLPIACVEGWSTSATWTGVPLSELLALAGGRERSARVISVEPGPYAVSYVPSNLAADPATLIALRLNGEVLDLDHGYPARLIAPNRPGALQTKWLRRIEVR